MIKKKKVIYLSTLLFLLSASTNLCVSCTNKRGIDIINDNTIIEEKSSDYFISWFGVKAYFFFDYTKLPKYEQWMQEYEQDETHQDDQYKFSLNDFINGKIIDEINILFTEEFYANNVPSLKCIIIYFNASNNNYETLEKAFEDMECFINKFYKSKNYRKLIKFSQEEYISEFVLYNIWPYMDACGYE